MDRAAIAAGVLVERMDFPYRKAGRRSPDRPAVLMAAVADEARSLSSRVQKVLLGGRSMGGRICSMAVAEGLVAAAGLVLVSYPLHPPGRPERMRCEHFPKISVPCLMVSGTRDAFASPSELEAATASIAGTVTHHWIDGKDHSMRGAEEVVAALVAGWLHGLDRR